MEELIEKNMGLVMTIVNKFNPKNSLERDRYIQAGRIGLWKALKKFSPERGTKFSPYAWRPIQWEIIKEIRSSKSKESHLFHSPSVVDQKEEGPSRSPKENFWELLPSSLTSEEQQVIDSRLEGYNFKEISGILNVNRSQVKKIFNSALKKIRDTNDH